MLIATQPEVETRRGVGLVVGQPSLLSSRARRAPTTRPIGGTDLSDLVPVAHHGFGDADNLAIVLGIRPTDHHPLAAPLGVDLIDMIGGADGTDKIARTTDRGNDGVTNAAATHDVDVLETASADTGTMTAQSDEGLVTLTAAVASSHIDAVEAVTHDGDLTTIKAATVTIPAIDETGTSEHADAIGTPLRTSTTTDEATTPEDCGNCGCGACDTDGTTLLLVASAASNHGLAPTPISPMIGNGYGSERVDSIDTGGTGHVALAS